MGRMLMILGASLLLTGLLLQYGGKWGLGQLPGDLRFQRDNVTFYFPLGTSLVVSVVISLLLWLFRRS